MSVPSSRPFSNVIALEPAVPVAGCTPPDDEIPAGVLHMAIMLTRKCNMSCAHCSVESSPKINGEPSDEELMESVRAAHENGVRSVLLTGGEPMLRPQIVFDLLDQARELGMMTALTSNGFWGKSPEKAEQTVARLQDAGLRLLTISYDRYHADYQGSAPAVNIARAATKAKLGFNVSITRTAQDADLESFVAPFADVPRANLRFYDVQPIGRARQFEIATLRAEIDGFCNACSAPALTDDGRMIACNGPAYFSADASSLVIGSTREEPMETLLRRHRQDPILEAIRARGPAWLLGELRQMEGFEGWARPRYGGMCDLCLHLNSDEKATAALRAHLAQPRLIAQMAAARQVIAAARRDELSRAAINGAQVARVWWNALHDPRSLRSAGAILGRADLNWSEQAEYLRQCGLSEPLLAALQEPELKRWAPEFFAKKLRKQALLDAARALMQRDALREIAQCARAANASGVDASGVDASGVDASGVDASAANANGVDASGVLLKGAAMQAWNGAETPRSACDIDVYFAPAVAARVHARLVERGFVVAPDPFESKAETRHQLPALVRGPVCIEIHQTLLPAICGAPERALLRGTRPLAGELRGLRVLGPEAMLLYNALHCSKHGWTHGLKTAADMAWITKNFPELNWNWLARMVARTGFKRGFWVPFSLLARELELPAPAWFLARAPRDARQRKLERVAQPLLFGATNAWFVENGPVYHAVFLLQSDSWLHRARYIAEVTVGAPKSQPAREPRQRTQNGERWAKVIRAAQAWRDL